MSEADIRQERLKKLEILQGAGMGAYPAHTGRDATVAEFTESFAEREKSGQQVSLAGRIMSLRGQGGIMFADLFDGSTSLTTGAAARTQIVYQKTDDNTDAFTLFTETVDKGDFIEVRGSAYTTKRGAQSLNVSEWKMLSKSLAPIPDEWFGLKDEEKKLRERDINILLDAELRAMFERKSKFWNAVRQFYLSRGFIEVETPVLESTPGGADARPFETHHNALDIDVYLRISCGELWQKRLLIAGFPKVFEIGRIFRNEGQSREHLQDYTQIESYEAYADAESGKLFLQDLYRYIAKEVYGKYTFEINGHTVDLADEWKTIDFCQAIEKEYGVHPLTCSEDEAIAAAKAAGVVFGEAPNRSRAIDHLWKKIRKTVSGPAFLTGVPVFLEPLAKRKDDNPEVVDRIQIVIAGSEVGKGYSELNDPLDQRARFEEQQTLRDQGDAEAQRMDSEYVHAMEYGMPPAFGFGMSERFFSFLENRPIHECQLFPLLRPKG